ncbi:SDR family NAD(P)-dependent oxidoreductase, partial [Mesorhizobium sp. M4A.F.Ca.ET.020.02.1.1]|uniref:SDR family NAD(P)-dependent oxidoreductase n=1 Tax=Mesorhizobium sp. M4A.F.Ca.ET.020.02.1.1 TaxID=2496652 RepID=UPI000FD53563
MNLELDDKVVLITGGSKGIGLACARAFAREGARVVIVSRSQQNLDAAKAKLAADGLSAASFAADLSDGLAAKQMVAIVEDQVGPIASLVNSAGGARRVPPDELTPDKWRIAMDAKFFTYMNVMDYVLPLMVQRQAGTVVNIVGTGGKVASPMHLPGGAANAALMLASAGLAAAWGPAGVGVN